MPDQSLQKFRKKSRLMGGADSWSLLNYMPPGYNPRAQTYEKHLPMASYEGPGTNVALRWVTKGLHGTTAVDEAARHHDIQYNNLGLLKARNKINQRQLENGIANSDKRLLAAANRNITSINPINNMHAWAAEAGIRAKRGLQYMNMMSKTAFTGSRPDSQYMDEEVPRYVDDLPADYLQGGKKKPKKKDRLKRLKKVLNIK